MNSRIYPPGRAGNFPNKLPLLWSLFAVCLIVAGGCRVAQKTASLPTSMVSVLRSGETKPPDPAALQAELLRYADDFIGRTASGADEYARQINTPEARSEALAWKVTLGSSVLGIASGANPTANLVDFLALSSLLRAFLEQRRSSDAHGAAFDLWLENSRVLESNAWNIADGILSASQQQQFRAAIGKWLAQNATQEAAFFGRPQMLASSIRQTGDKERQPGSVFTFVGLDPTAGLDPAVREVTRTRLFAERALFAMERMPFLLRWQTELFTDRFLREQQLTNALASADRLTRAAESVSQTTAALPDRVSAERKAILDALDAQEGRLRDLSAQVSQTLAAGERMSTSLNTTIGSFDSLMKRFGVGEPSSGLLDTNSPPFNILDYAQTAERVAAMAQELDALIKDASGTVDAPGLDKRMAQLNAFSAKARSDAKSVLNHAFLLAAGLIVLIFLCAFAYRKLASPPSSAAGEPLLQNPRSQAGPMAGKQM